MGTPFITPDDQFLFNEGSHFRLYEKLGAHPGKQGGKKGVFFSVWAPDAKAVGVIGDFNHWTDPVPLAPTGNTGIWHAFIPGLASGALYKYRVEPKSGDSVDKADPVGFLHETPPKTASIVWDLDYEWSDQAWMEGREWRNSLSGPISIYEVHLGSWMRADDGSWLGYRQAAERLVEYVKEAGFTHVELLPIMEHPFYGSWGYQTTGYFAPTHRYGKPQDLMYLVDYLHQNDIGVILDWVPSHFPGDEHGLAQFDGTHLYEHADPRLGFHPDWKSCIFNYGRHEVRSFLISSAIFWLDRYHVDGLRVDAVASMLYLDYSREEGEWIPNEFGGRENLDAMRFLRRLNEEIYASFPGVQTYAEESTAWPMVSRPTYLGGLGFGLKWDMGWMHDTLEYMKKDPIHRTYHHNELTFRMVYAFNENFVLALSHDEVVHGKGSLVGKMPGDDWQQRANLRLLYGYMFAQPGKKLLFMGQELAAREEWNHDSPVNWDLLKDERHEGVRRWVSRLNELYAEEPALHEWDFDGRGFTWVEANDSASSIISFTRQSSDGSQILAVFNFTPVPRDRYRVGVDAGGTWQEIANSDAKEYGGSGVGNLGAVEAKKMPSHGRPYSIDVRLPPLGAVWLRSP